MNQAESKLEDALELLDIIKDDKQKRIFLVSNWLLLYDCIGLSLFGNLFLTLEWNYSRVALSISQLLSSYFQTLLLCIVGLISLSIILSILAALALPLFYKEQNSYEASFARSFLLMLWLILMIVMSMFIDKLWL